MLQQHQKHNLLVNLLFGGLAGGVFTTAPAAPGLTVVRRLSHAPRVITVPPASLGVPARVLLGERGARLVVVLEPKEEELVFEMVVVAYCVRGERNGRGRWEMGRKGGGEWSCGK